MHPSKWSLIRAGPSQSGGKIPLALGVDGVQAAHQVLEEELEGLRQTQHGLALGKVPREKIWKPNSCQELTWM